MKLRNLIKVVEKVIAPEPLEEIKEEDIECAIDEQVVPCKELKNQNPLILVILLLLILWMILVWTCTNSD